MAYIDAIFVTQRGLEHEVIQTPVRRATHSRYAHAAVRMTLGSKTFIVEAKRQGVIKSKPNSYDNEPILNIVRIPISDANYIECVATAIDLLGLKYGYDDCLVGYVHDNLGDEASHIAAKIFNDDGTRDCSAVLTDVLRVEYPNFAMPHESCEITPEVAEQNVMVIPGIEVIIDREEDF